MKLKHLIHYSAPNGVILHERRQKLILPYDEMLKLFTTAALRVAIQDTEENYSFYDKHVIPVYQILNTAVNPASGLQHAIPPSCREPRAGSGNRNPDPS